MENTPYIKEEYAKKAEEMERKFLGLGKGSGILFVGVRPMPSDSGIVKNYTVMVGMRKEFTEGTAVALAKRIFQDEIDNGVIISVVPMRGIAGPASDQQNIN